MLVPTVVSQGQSRICPAHNDGHFPRDPPPLGGGGAGGVGGEGAISSRWWFGVGVRWT